MGHWEARAKYADGSEVSRDFAYTAGGNYETECEEQYSIECWLLERDGVPAIWYSVDYVDDYDAEEDGC